MKTQRDSVHRAVFGARTTPDSYHLMPEVLDFLKRANTEVEKKTITVHMREYILSRRLDQRDRSIDWALNRLEKAGLVLHRRRGHWQATAKGLSTSLSESDAKAIMEDCVATEKIARISR